MDRHVIRQTFMPVLPTEPMNSTRIGVDIMEWIRKIGSRLNAKYWTKGVNTIGLMPMRKY